MRQLTNDEKTIWSVVFIVEGAVIIICNILSILVFWRKARFSKPRLLLMNQCFADLLVGIDAIYMSDKFIGHIDHLNNSNMSTEQNQVSCFTIHYTEILWNYIVDLSLSSLALIALDRAFAVFKPFRHRVLRSKHYFYGILCVWVLSALPACNMAILHCLESNEIQNTANLFIGAVAILFATVVIVCCYTSIYVKLKFFPVFRSSASFHTRSEIKLSLTLFFASLASMSTVIPTCVITAYFFTHPSSLHPNNLDKLSLFLMFANSFINFVIYVWRFPEFSEDVKTFCCRIVVNESHSTESRNGIPLQRMQSNLV